MGSMSVANCTKYSVDVEQLVLWLASSRAANAFHPSDVIQHAARALSSPLGSPPLLPRPNTRHSVGDERRTKRLVKHGEA